MFCEFVVRWKVGPNEYKESYTSSKLAQDKYDSLVRRGFTVLSRRPI